MSLLPMNRGAYGQPSVYGQSPDYGAPEMQNIDRQRALAMQLKKQGEEQLQGQMVSGHFVAPSFTQGLAKILQQGLAASQLRDADVKEKDYNSKKNQAYADILNGNKANKIETEPTVTTSLPAYTPDQLDQFGSPLPGIQRTPTQTTQQNFTTETPEQVADRQRAAVYDYVQKYGASPEAQLLLSDFNHQRDRGEKLADVADARNYENTTHTRDRGEHLQDVEKAQEFQRIMQKEQFGQQLTMQEKQFANQYKLQQSSQAFQAGQQANSQNFQAGQNALNRDQQLTLAGMKNGGANSPQQKVQDARDVLDILKQSAPLINQSTNSGLGNIIDQGASFFGTSTKGAQSAASLKALEGVIISKMPKMSGPQSDKDVLLYRQMAGQIGDPTLPAAQKKSAMNTIAQLQSKYAGVEYEPLDFGDAQMTPSQALGGLPSQDAIAQELKRRGL